MPRSLGRQRNSTPRMSSGSPDSNPEPRAVSGSVAASSTSRSRSELDENASQSTNAASITSAHLRIVNSDYERLVGLVRRDQQGVQVPPGKRSYLSLVYRISNLHA